jgi:D-alanine-D-alanine ligase
VASLAELADVDLPFPLIVKPTCEDASVGISSTSVVHDSDSLTSAVERVLREHAQPALVEQFIDGREVYVSLLGNHPPAALPFHEIDFSDLPDGLPKIVTYAGKWDSDSPEFHGTRPVRCDLDEPTRARVEHVARAAFRALDLRDYARVDVRLARDGTPFVIDVNPNCDLSDGAGFSRAAGFAGLDHPALVEQVCLSALERHAHAGATPARTFLFAPPRGRRSLSAQRPVLVGRSVSRRRAR